MVKNCSFNSKDSPCHQNTHTEKKTMRNVEDDELQLLALRTKISEADIETICCHHDQLLIKKFSTLKRKCCDPYSSHSKIRRKSLQVVTAVAYGSLMNPPECVIPGEKVCCACMIKLKQTPDETSTPSAATCSDPTQMHDDESVDTESSELMSTTEFSSPEKNTSLTNINAALVRLDETPVKTGGLAPSSKKSKGKQKLKRGTIKLRRGLEKLYETQLESSESETDNENHDLELYNSMFNELKNRFKQSNSYAERVQILTLSPFTIERTMQLFEATNYMVKKSRTVKKEKGILGQCDKKKGKAMDLTLRDKILHFYENDDNSRMCPGAKEKVSVRNKNGEKEEHQKRLVLCNLKELHAAFNATQMQFGLSKVGFSTFATLRPKWCVLAGTSGTHSVCVCRIHQNPKLMVESFSFTTNQLMASCVCSTENEACMMGYCKSCPSKQGTIDFLQNCGELADLDDIGYKQWVSVDRTQLITIVEPKEEFVDTLSNQISKLTRHSYIAKSQKGYMNNLKSTMTPMKEAVVQGDFAENYSFVIQDEIQSYHWENSQATLHPFVAYYRSDDESLEHLNMCVISNCKEHNTVVVHTFLKHVIPYLKLKLPQVEKIHYFTDGCSGQYKNKYNFINLCYHQADFDLECEWNFFATSHGKSACDGIGGTVKRLVRKASLQRPSTDHILTTTSMFEWCLHNISGIYFFHVDMAEVAISEEELRPKFECAKTIPGTLQYHRFVPATSATLKAFKTSSQTTPPKLVPISDVEPMVCSDEILQVPFIIKEQTYVCCMYDEFPWIGMVEKVSEKFGDFLIIFMHPHGPSTQFRWPLQVDRCWLPEKDILCIVNTPSLTSSSSRNYMLSRYDLLQISKVCPNWSLNSSIAEE